MVRALYCRSGEDSSCMFDTRHERFFFFFFMDDDDGASRKARALKRVQSTKPEGVKRPRMGMQSTKLEDQRDRESKRKAQGSEATELTCLNERSECRR